MPIINVNWTVGRTVEQKRVVATRITEAMVEIGLNAASVTVVFDDVPRDSWAAGGTLMADK